jgi:endogenous inhibitor of DNA gyrase (YacG/DUF329 family)
VAARRVAVLCGWCADNVRIPFCCMRCVAALGRSADQGGADARGGSHPL